MNFEIELFFSNMKRLGFTIIGNYYSIEEDFIEMEEEDIEKEEILELEEEDLIEACQNALETKGSRNPLKYIRDLVRGGKYRRER